jgi:aconitate hydratase
VIAESYERIHRSNLVGMGVLPLQFSPGESAATLGIDGTEVYTIAGLATAAAAPGGTVRVTARHPNGAEVRFDVTVRIDTPREVLYYRHGGILPYVLRRLLEPGVPTAAGAATAAGSVAADPRPEPGPRAASADEPVEEGVNESFPASDPPVY